MKRLLLLMMLPGICIAQKRATVMSPAATKSDIAAANAPSFPMKDGAVFYEFVDSSLKKEKIDVYKAAKIWFADIFKNSKSVLQVDDKELGELVGKGTFKYSFIYGGVELDYWCQFTAKISCRKNKYRIQIYDIGTRPEDQSDYISIDGMNGSTDPLIQAGARKIDDRISGIILSSRQAIAQQSDNF